MNKAIDGVLLWIRSFMKFPTRQITQLEKLFYNPQGEVMVCRGEYPSHIFKSLPWWVTELGVWSVVYQNELEQVMRRNKSRCICTDASC